MTDDAMTKNAPGDSRPRLPAWLRRPVSHHGGYQSVSSCLAGLDLHTVCVEANCPNRSECYSSGTATFLIMGNVCTRRCRFCGVAKGTPPPLEPDEGSRAARAAVAMKLRHVVITSVTRDDLPDGGASHFAGTIDACREVLPKTTIEVLIPDFQGDRTALENVIEAGPDVLNHNVETVPRLYGSVRPLADYACSLTLLRRAAEASMTVKSGLMVGLGESEEEVEELLKDLRKTGCSIVTIGQYLQPSRDHTPVVEFVPPEQFERYEDLGRSLGFSAVFSGPLVRSSYRAGKFVKRRL